MISRYGVLKAMDKDRATVNVAALNALIKRGLVAVDTTTSLHQGQSLHVTAEGQCALAQHKPATAPRPNCGRDASCDQAGRRGTHAMTGFAPTDRVLVSPVYLVGPGNSTVARPPADAAPAATPGPRR